MKILHYAPDLQGGGADLLAADLAFALQVFDVQSTLVAPANAQVSITPSTLLRHVRYSSHHLFGQWGLARKLRGLIVSRTPDIVQAYGYNAIITASKICNSLPSNRRPKLVGVLSGYPPGGDILRSPEILGCDALTVVAKHLRQHLSGAAEAYEKAWVIPYGVNETLCHPGYKPSTEWQESWKRTHPELSDRFVVCLPGPISAMHGSADVVPMVSTLLQQDIQAHILIAGDSAKADPEFITTLRRRMRSAGIEQHFTWVDAPKQLRDIMCSCHAVINLATSPEAYNRPMLEALALGRPVVGYDHGVAGEYLEAFQPVGTVPVGDFDAVADVLSQWHSYPPDPVESIPYPYRLSDTAKSYYDLYTSLT